MNFEEVDVEAVVRAVMARLGGDSLPVPAAISVVTKSHELTLLGRLVTENDLIGRLRDEKVLRIQPGTVLTPSARDYLKSRRIEIQTIAKTAATKAKSPAFRLAVGVAETKFEPSGIVTQLKRDGFQIEQVARVGLTGVVDELADRASKGGDRGLLFTSRPAAAACLANRHRGVRAATARDAGEVREIMNELNANFLVMNPSVRATHTVLQAIRAWHTGTSVALTAELQQRLG